MEYDLKNPFIHEHDFSSPKAHPYCGGCHHAGFETARVWYRKEGWVKLPAEAEMAVILGDAIGFFHTPSTILKAASIVLAKLRESPKDQIEPRGQI